MKQWALRITAYADRLLTGLDQIDWPNSVKEQQKNWIGKSSGLNIIFKTENNLTFQFLQLDLKQFLVFHF